MTSSRRCLHRRAFRGRESMNKISSQKKQAILFSFAIAFLLAASGLVPRAQTPSQAAGQGQAAGRGQGRGQQGGQGRGGGAGGGQADPWPGKKKLLAVADTQSGFH